MNANESDELEKFVPEFYGEYCLRQMAMSVGWVSDTLRLGELLISGKLVNYDSDIFFIRLHAVVVELPNFLKTQFLPAEAIRMLNEMDILPAINEEYEILSSRAFKTQQHMSSQFSDVDLRILRFLRDRGSHLILHGYMITHNKNGELVIDDGQGTEKPQKRREILKLISERNGPAVIGIDFYNRCKPALIEFEYLLKRQLERIESKIGHLFTKN